MKRIVPFLFFVHASVLDGFSDRKHLYTPDALNSGNEGWTKLAGE